MKYAVAKNNSQGFLTREDFYLIINSAQSQYLEHLVGEYEKYQLRRPIPVVAVGQSQRLRESIAPLIYNVVLSPNTTTGIAAFPSDYESTDSMRTIYNFYRIRFVQQDSLFSNKNSVIDPPNTDNPIYLIQHEGFQFYPENIASARLGYLRTPPSIVWGYSVDSNGREVYNPATSQQPVWNDLDIFQIIVRALSLVGVNLQIGAVMNYANEIKTQGQ